MLVARNADDYTALANWRIQQRGDAVRLEVALGELRCPVIEVAIVGSKSPVQLQCPKVRGVIACEQFLAVRVLPAGTKVQILAHDPGSFIVEQPDGRALDIERLRRNLGDHVERDGEVFRLIT